MISYLRGNLKYISEKFIILDVNGVGYRVFVTPRTLSNLKKKKKEIELFIYSYLREDTHELYGFLTFEELEFFEEIVGVAGIGPRVGMNIMAEASISKIKSAVAKSDFAFFDRIPGIGRKKAQRFVLEIQDKVKTISEKGEKESEIYKDALSALLQLGYKKREAERALQEVPEEIEEVGKKVKYALKILSRRR